VSRVTAQAGARSDTQPMTQARHQASIPAEFSAGPLKGIGQIKNLNEGGLFVATPSIPQQGESVLLKFSPSGGEWIELSGMVWWTTTDPAGQRHRHAGFGLRLLEENEAYRGWVESLPPR